MSERRTKSPNRHLPRDFERPSGITEIRRRWMHILRKCHEVVEEMDLRIQQQH